MNFDYGGIKQGSPQYSRREKYVQHIWTSKPYTKWIKSDNVRLHLAWVHVYEFSKKGKIKETENKVSTCFQLEIKDWVQMGIRKILSEKKCSKTGLW